MDSISDIFTAIQQVRSGVGDGWRELVDGNIDIASIPHGGIGAIDFITNVLWEQLQEKCDELENKCADYNDSIDEYDAASQAYIDAFDVDCVARCEYLIDPLSLQCFICNWLDDVGGNPCEFNWMGFGQ